MHLSVPFFHIFVHNRQYCGTSEYKITTENVLVLQMSSELASKLAELANWWVSGVLNGFVWKKTTIMSVMARGKDS